MLVPTPEGDHEIGIVRAHLEEDAAKTTHVGGRTGRIGGADYSLVDFNRGGTPLVEIVTGPDIHSSEDARRFLQLLRQTIVELGISDAEMEKGTLRVDANVSVRPEGSSELRTRCELKNMNSFRFVAQGIDAEVARQIAVYESGGEVVQETYDFDAGSGTLTARRSKEEADDYRYFPEPDLVPIEPPRSWSNGCAPRCRRARRAGSAGSRPSSTSTVPSCSSRGARRRSGRRRSRPAPTGSPAANLIANRLAGVDADAVDPAELAKLVEARDRIPRAALDEALEKVATPGFSAEPYLAQEAVSDTAELEPIVIADPRGEPRPGRRLQGRQGGAARLLRRPGDEGDRRQGERARGQRARAREAPVASRP